MFASLFNDEDKNVFIEIINKVRTCDGESSIEEQNCINEYMAEFGVTEIQDTKELDELIKYFTGREESLKKAVYYNIYMMMMADGKLNQDELMVQRKLELSLDLRRDQYEDIVKAADSLQLALEAVTRIVEE